MEQNFPLFIPPPGPNNVELRDILWKGLSIGGDSIRKADMTEEESLFMAGGLELCGPLLQRRRAGIPSEMPYRLSRANYINEYGSIKKVHTCPLATTYFVKIYWSKNGSLFTDLALSNYDSLHHL